MQAAILQTAGPFTIHQVVLNNYRFLKSFTCNQFLEAATALQAQGLGTVANIGTQGGRKAFIKKPPDEVGDILKANPDLCSPDYYRKRYSQPLSKYVSLFVRHQVASMKLVPAKLMM